MSYLITQSLISSWNYMFSCREKFRKNAYNDFLNTLNRVHKETTPEMRNGIDFENEVYKAAAGVARDAHPEWESGINAVASVIKGAPVQVRAQRELTIGSMELLVYGIMDALRAGVIYDVKFSNENFSKTYLAGKYLNSPQHSTYFFVEPGAREFQYLVSDGVDLYTETYTPENSRPFNEIAEEFLSSLDAMNLLDLYKERWPAK